MEKITPVSSTWSAIEEFLEESVGFGLAGDDIDTVKEALDSHAVEDFAEELFPFIEREDWNEVSDRIGKFFEKQGVFDLPCWNL